jgi:hypothetical protein
VRDHRFPADRIESIRLDDGPALRLGIREGTFFVMQQAFALELIFS